MWNDLYSSLTSSEKINVEVGDVTFSLIVLRHYSSLEVASEYFRSGADKVSIGSDAVYAAEEYLRNRVCMSVIDISSKICLLFFLISFNHFKVKSGKSSLEQISRVYGNQVIVPLNERLYFLLSKQIGSSSPKYYPHLYS